MFCFESLGVALDPKSFINLERVSVLALEQSAYGQKILSQVLRGLGVQEVHGATDLERAKEIVSTSALNLIIADPGFADGSGIEFLRWARRLQGSTNRFAPIILMLGHTTQTAVGLARDAGANAVLVKPYAPKILLERIVSVSRDKRPYVEAPTYVGPDRRFREEALPEGMAGRRVGDPALGEVRDGEAA